MSENISHIFKETNMEINTSFVPNLPLCSGGAVTVQFGHAIRVEVVLLLLLLLETVHEKEFYLQLSFKQVRITNDISNKTYRSAEPKEIWKIVNY